MAKITIAGDAVVVTSAMKLEDIKTVKKYRPDALVLRGGEDGKEPIFKLGVCAGAGSICKYGAEFGSETHDDEKKAVMTLICDCREGDIKEAVADTIGAYVLNLNKLEATLPGVLEEIAAEKEQIMSNISVAQ
ncbi:MAG: hypothetical protein Q4F79_00215 [Eubacteriales bacterium]|nr:hypothetical protein [Eubacteriales bacterium]